MGFGIWVPVCSPVAEILHFLLQKTASCLFPWKHRCTVWSPQLSHSSERVGLQILRSVWFGLLIAFCIQTAVTGAFHCDDGLCCIIFVVLLMYVNVFLQCLHTVFVLSTTWPLSFLVFGKPKCHHTSDLNEDGASSISTSTLVVTMLETVCYKLLFAAIAPVKRVCSKHSGPCCSKHESRFV